MAVQLLEQWLLNEQAKIQKNYRDLNQLAVKEPGIIFIGVRLWNISRCMS